ncbi:MAG TPA: Na/Pi symporter, partial [bacterium]|nr:Na/Pi symporter [bacterium]
MKTTRGTNTKAATLFTAALFAFVLLCSRTASTPSHGMSIEKTGGDFQFVIEGERAGDALSVRVFGAEGKPAASAPVYFKIISSPAGGKRAALSGESSVTDKQGKTSVKFTAGGDPGVYLIKANAFTADGPFVIFKETGKTKNWVFILLGAMTGGLGLFLYGMNMMGQGLQEWAGDQMRSILGTLTKHRVYGLAVGMVVTAIMNSSSATTVMLVGFTNAGLMTLRQALGVILGADVGSTVTAQIVAFNTTALAYPLIAVGFVLTFVSKQGVARHYGSMLL